jgi:hypothetical protein
VYNPLNKLRFKHCWLEGLNETIDSIAFSRGRYSIVFVNDIENLQSLWNTTLSDTIELLHMGDWFAYASIRSV